MCGFAGISFLAESYRRQEGVVRTMADSLSHRGPDDVGVWISQEDGIALSHRRLSVIDVSPAGHQPMISHSDRYVIVLNGEIYNHTALKNELSTYDIAWRGHSDTEVLLAAIDYWGVATALRKAVGMFAFALWDRKDQSLILARDRFGEKPLYYGWQGDTFLFGSELKALCKHPSFKSEINHEVVPLYLRKGYIPSPLSIWKGIYKLNPGTFLRLDHPVPGMLPDPVQFWSLSEAALKGVSSPFIGSDDDALAELERVLSGAVNKQMVADVPLGAFLSGGIDSTTVVALMQAQSSRPVNTFSIGFHEAGYNEATHAKAVAKHLGTDHTELYVNSKDVLAVIPKLPRLYDEPFSDSSQIPTFLVSEMARRHVTVSLSGDGGDELFGGYNRYFKTKQWWHKVRRAPLWTRRLAAHGLMSVRSGDWDRVERFLASISRSETRWSNLSHKIMRLSGVLDVNDTSSLYRHFTTHWPHPDEILINGREPSTFVTQPPINLDSAVEQMMALDTLTYLPDDILVKVDRAAMAVGLETRVPMLDLHVVEFAWSLPLSMKIRNGQGKWLLRQVLYKYVPKELIERPKVGFGVPLDRWLRGPLRDWAESLLNEDRLRQEGFFNPAPIRHKWVEHLSGKRNWQYDLWDVLTFQAWLEQEQSH